VEDWTTFVLFTICAIGLIAKKKQQQKQGRFSFFFWQRRAHQGAARAQRAHGILELLPLCQ
jgi:predicted transcriptional regulator